MHKYVFTDFKKPQKAQINEKKAGRIHSNVSGSSERCGNYEKAP